MASFLQGLGQAYGRSLIVGQEMAEKQSLIDERRTTIAQQKQQMAMLAKQQQTQEEVGSYVSSEMQKDSSIATDPAKSSKLYENAAGVALRNGDFKSANTMNELAKSKLQEAKEAAVYQAQQLQLKKEDLANAADSLSTNPTPEGVRDLMQKAVAAGVNPTTIPQPGTPAFAAWVNQQKLASKSASERADYLEKVKEANDKMQERKLEHEDNMQLKREQRQQTAMLREAMLSIQEGNLALRREELDYKKSQGVPGGKQSANERAADKAIIASSREALRGLHIVGAMDSAQTSGPFSGLHDGTILEALSKTGTNSLTPEDMQIYQTATAGLGLEVARAMTLGGGRGANQSTINEMQEIIRTHPGDTKGTAIFKYANAVDIIRNRLESMSTPQDPEQAKLRESTLAELSKIPTPQQVLKATKDPKQRKAMLAAQGSMEDVAGKIQDQSLLPSAAPAGASTPGLPSGWSVKEH